MEPKALQYNDLIMETLSNPNPIIVADRAYFRTKRLDSFIKHHQPFVIHRKINVSLHQKVITSLEPKELKRYWGYYLLSWAWSNIVIVS